MGTSFGLAITTIIFNRVRDDETAKLGIHVGPFSEDAPAEAQLLAYRSASWGAFAFGVVGESLNQILHWKEHFTDMEPSVKDQY